MNIQASIPRDSDAFKQAARISAAPLFFIEDVFAVGGWPISRLGRLSPNARPSQQWGEAPPIQVSGAKQNELWGYGVGTLDSLTRQSLRSRANQTLAALAAVKLVMTLARANLYGWQRDELYYLDASKHLAWGYVDYPPLTPFLLALHRRLLGTSLLGARLLPALAGAGVVLLAGLLARRLGGAPPSRPSSARCT